MPKPPNDLDSVIITITTTPQVKEALSKLVRTGYFGKNGAEAAERLVARAVDGELRERGMEQPTSRRRRRKT